MTEQNSKQPLFSTKTAIGKLLSTPKQCLEECFDLIQTHNIKLCDQKGNIITSLDSLSGVTIDLNPFTTSMFADEDIITKLFKGLYEVSRMEQCLQQLKENNIFIKEPFSYGKIADTEQYLYDTYIAQQQSNDPQATINIVYLSASLSEEGESLNTPDNMYEVI